MASSAPIDLAALGPDALREWSVLQREPGRVLIGHWNLALAWVEVDSRERVAGHRLVEGEEARETRARLVPPR